MNTLMPDRVEILSSLFSKQQLFKMYQDVEENTSVESISNFKNLFTYKRSKVISNKLILVDNAMGGEDVSVKRVYAAYEKYVDLLSDSLRGKSDMESLLKIYNYVYDNFDYTATSAWEMNITNIGNGKMACNGLSRLMNDLLNKVGISSEIRQGETHFWNIANINGQAITVDVTTDILKRKPLLTLGTSSSEHKRIVFTTGMYDASYDSSKYKEIEKFATNKPY